MSFREIKTLNYETIIFFFFTGNIPLYLKLKESEIIFCFLKHNNIYFTLSWQHITVHWPSSGHFHITQNKVQRSANFIGSHITETLFVLPLILFLVLWKWPDNGQLTVTCHHNKTKNIVVFDGKQKLFHLILRINRTNKCTIWKKYWVQLILNALFSVVNTVL